MRIVVGLGNPGRRYNGSRHNVGFECVDLISKALRIKLSERRPKAVLGQDEFGGAPVVLAKPRTFMNNSGEAVAYLLTRFGASPSQLVVIYDEMDLPVGSVRIQPRGSSAGHNGIESILSALATPEFSRVRVGIGKPPEEAVGRDHVLGRFSREEDQVIKETVPKVAEAVLCLLEEGIDVAMNRYN